MTDRTNGEERGSMDGGGMGEFSVVREIGTSMGEIWKKWGNVLGGGGR